MITQTRLKQLLRYSSKTGKFFWLVSWGRGSCVNGGARYGKCAGCLGKRCWDIRVDGKLYRAHRLAWMYVYGKFPKGDIDHKNGNPLDNRITNLREATRVQNSGNSKVHEDNKNGIKGVTKNKFSWVAQIGKNYTTIYLGSYKTPKAAHAAYRKAAKKLHGAYARF